MTSFDSVLTQEEEQDLETHLVAKLFAKLERSRKRQVVDGAGSTWTQGAPAAGSACPLSPAAPGHEDTPSH